MNILMITPEVYFQPKGTPFSAYNRALILSELGHNLDIVTYNCGEDRLIKNTRLIRCARVPFIRDVKSGPSLAKAFMDISLSLKVLELLLKNRYDVVYSHEEAGLFGGLFGRILRKKTVYDMHSYIPELFEDWGYGKSALLSGFGDFLLRIIISLSDIIVTNCTNLTEEIRKISPQKKVFTIENAAVMRNFAKDKKKAAQLKKDLGIKKEKLIVYTGSFVRLQNLELLLRSVPYVAEKQKNVKFILVGAKNKEEMDMYKRIIDELKTEKYVMLKERVPPEEIPLYLEIADIVVSPRVKGLNVPFKLYSLMESGKPIVASQSMLYNTFLDDTNSILAEADPESFAGALLMLLRDENLRKRLSIKAKKDLTAKFSYETYVRKMKALCLEIENGRKA